MLDAGVVDEDVERPELRLHRRDARLGRLAVGDVERDMVQAAAGLLGGAGQLRGGPLERLGVAPMQRDRAARLHQALRERAADPAARARHERGAPADVEHAVRHAAVMSTFADASASSAVRIASGASCTSKRCETMSAKPALAWCRASRASVPS